jgi:hypothetical protein
MENKYLNFHILLIYYIIMESNKILRPDPGLKLMEQVRQVLRYHHYAYRTEQTYCDWILSYIRFHGSKPMPEIWEKWKSTHF